MLITHANEWLKVGAMGLLNQAAQPDGTRKPHVLFHGVHQHDVASGLPRPRLAHDIAKERRVRGFGLQAVSNLVLPLIPLIRRSFVQARQDAVALVPGQAWKRPCQTILLDEHLGEILLGTPPNPIRCSVSVSAYTAVCRTLVVLA